ncbi:MAG: alpha/beta fold hydrolase [Mycobacteriaceae bacterium]|nr:alpha/beta fold hydrolase [Mycobacteriaceae bacterium]
MTPARRLTGLLAVAAVVAACGTGERHPPASSTSAPPAPAASYAKAPCPNPMYTGAPEFDLGPAVECGYLTVPQNRADPNSRKIKLAVAVRKATSPDPKPDPVVYLAGGPGNSPFLHTFDDWQLDRDLILIGQRGTMKDDPFLACPEVDQFRSDAVGIGAQAPAYAQRSGAAVRACRQRVANDVIDVAAYDTAQSAADIADLRTAMGIGQWNIYALSYGTDLALQVLRDHPDGIRSVVLDSVLPPQANPVESGWDWAAHSFTAIFDACAADSACGAAFPDVRAEFIRMVNELSANPVRVTVDAGGKPTDVVIDGYQLASGVVAAAAKTPGQLARIPAMIHKLAAGDPTDVAQALTMLAPPNTASDGLMYTVLCGESVERTSPDKVLAAAKQALPDFPDAVLSLPAQMPAVFSDCAQWQVPAAPASMSQPVTSDIPTLLVSGSLDSVTPPPLADEGAQTLPNARHLVFPGSGHEVAASTADAANCFIEVMRNFFDDPSAYNADCVGALTVPPFAS